MSFKVVHAYALHGIDHGDDLLKSLDAMLFKGAWYSEDEIISNTKGSDAVIGVVSRQPFTRRVLETLTNCRILSGIGMALMGEWPTYGLNPEIREAWLNKWGREV